MPAYRTNTLSNPITDDKIPNINLRPTVHECVGEDDVITREVITDPSDAIKLDKQCYSKSQLKLWIEACDEKDLRPTVPHSKRVLKPFEIYQIYIRRRGGKLKNIKKSRKSRNTYRKIKNKTKKTKYRNKK